MTTPPDPATVISGSDTAPAAGDRLAGRRILVAEDNLVSQQIAARMLEKLGCKADVANHGREAVDMHRAACYDLVLMDCDMPELNGYQATERIRAMEGAPRLTPVVALTASLTQSEQEKCLACGMDDFLSKPIRPQLLKETLDRWLPPVAAFPSEPAAGDCGDELDMVHTLFGADFAELAALYRNDSPPRIAALHQAYAAGECERMAKVAHAFSGSSASIGATGLSALCKQLEISAKMEVLDDVEKRLAAIEAEYCRVSSKIQSLLS
jgi:CheY-like chemotaxis protein/HPt (histidine-containing phosphotransfer) domain-containing protein